MSYNVNFYEHTCPTWMGRGAVKQVGIEAKERGCKNVMIVTDPFLANTPIIEKVKKSLDDQGIKYFVFDKINVDPLDTIVEEGAEFAKAQKADGIVGVGGGSSLDGAKSIDLLVTNPPPISLYYYSWDFKPSIPLILVPTTTGTGSENTFYSVISDTKLNVKKVPLKKADIAICDPDLTDDLPAGLTAATAMDAFAHAAECMTGLLQCPKTDALCGWGIKLIMENLPLVIADGHNKEARDNMMIASNLIGAGFGVMGCHLGHAFGQCIGARFHTTHGISCAWPLPATMRYAARTEGKKVRMVADYMGIGYPQDISDEAIGELVAEGILDLMRRVNLAPMSKYGITRDALIDIADIVMQDNCWPVIPSPLTKEEVEEMLAQIWDECGEKI